MCEEKPVTGLAGAAVGEVSVGLRTHLLQCHRPLIIAGFCSLENVGGYQHQVVQFGSCAFGVQGIEKDSNAVFYVGAQDIIDIYQ